MVGVTTSLHRCPRRGRLYLFGRPKQRWKMLPKREAEELPLACRRKPPQCHPFPFAAPGTCLLGWCLEPALAPGQIWFELWAAAALLSCCSAAPLLVACSVAGEEAWT